MTLLLTKPIEMIERPQQEIASATSEVDAAAQAGLMPQLGMMDRVLSEDEQQRLAFASLVLHAPRWVLVDEVLDSLDDDALQRAIDVFARDLERTGILYIGRAQTHEPLFSTRRLPRNALAAAQTATAAA